MNLPVGLRGRAILCTAMTYRLPLVLLAIALSCGVLTFQYLDNFPVLAHGRRGPPLFEAWELLLTFLLLTAPLLWIAALAERGSVFLAILNAHAAVYTALLTITAVTDAPGHSSPGDAFGQAILTILFIILGVEAFVGLIAFHRMKQSPTDAGVPRFLYLGLTTSLLSGWFMGILAWSAVLPPRIVAAAEAAALNRPYCIEVDGTPAQATGDLIGMSLRAINGSAWIFSFHALLVIGAPADRIYMNWSYRSGRFEQVSQNAREGLHLDAQTKCSPVAHFAREWS